MASSSRSPPFSNALFIPFDPSSPLFVAKGVLTTGTIGAITGASIGVIQSQNPFALSINMTINLSIAGLTFFGIREYLVSPILLASQATTSHARRYAQLQAQNRSQYQLSSKALGKLPDFDTDFVAPLSLNQVRMDRMLDSAISGGLAGGTLSAAFRGRATFVKAAIISSLIASVLQLSANQLRVIRLQLLAKRAETIASSSSTIASPSTSSSSSSSSSSSKNPAISSNQPSLPLQASFEEPLKPSSIDITNRPTLPERMMSALSKVLPVRKLSNDEYLAMLEKKKQDVDKRLKEIEDEEKRMWDWAQAQEQKSDR